MESTTRICRIQGLTSDKGQSLNGSAGLADVTAAAAKDRLPVHLDGRPGEPLSIKTSNLCWFDSTVAQQYSTGVGRGTIRDEQAQAIVAYNNAPIIRVMLSVNAGGARCRGNLQVVDKLLKQIAAGSRPAVSSQSTKICVTLTDLNVARALNSMVQEQQRQDATPRGLDILDTSTEKSIRKSLRQLKDTYDMLFCFDSHRIHPDNFKQEGGLGDERYHAVLTGTFQIYPCPHENFHDALEVRYAKTNPVTDMISIRQDMYLDYGVEEAVLYAKNAAGLLEWGRLGPAALAQVDPQAFWSAVLHVDLFLRTLQEIGAIENLQKQWVDVAKGVEASRQNRKGPLHLYEPGGHWGIENDKKHGKKASMCAMDALSTVLKEVSSDKPVRIDIQDHYKNTEIGRLFNAHMKASEMASQRRAKGRKVTHQHKEQFLNQALADEGFGDDVLDLASDPLASCGKCGKDRISKLKDCGKCGGIAYCCRECQVADWKRHRKECNRVLQDARHTLRHLVREEGIAVNTALYKPTSSLPTQPGMFSEASGVGATAIMWIPGGPSHITFVNQRPDLALGQLENLSLDDNMVQFSRISELNPLYRFLVSCGPLPDIAMAKNSLEEALAFVGEDIDRLRIRGACFTALEWAAKKGNLETVKWLCEDERTKGLISIGAPVGWACYTGQVEIARTLVGYGASAGATDVVLWNHLPPLMVAAENGQLSAMQYLVDELGHDINMKDSRGRDVMKHITDTPNWRELEGHKACRKWLKKKQKEADEKE